SSRATLCGRCGRRSPGRPGSRRRCGRGSWVGLLVGVATLEAQRARLREAMPPTLGAGVGLGAGGGVPGTVARSLGGGGVPVPAPYRGGGHGGHTLLRVCPGHTLGTVGHGGVTPAGLAPLRRLVEARRTLSDQRIERRQDELVVALDPLAELPLADPRVRS